jgi:hypothetical protein
MTGEEARGEVAGAGAEEDDDDEEEGLEEAGTDGARIGK